MHDLTLDPRQTALVLIDLQAGILARPGAPHPSADVLARCCTLAARFREVGAQVVLVRVSFAPDFVDALTPPTDVPPFATRPPGWDVLSPQLGEDPRDIRVTKRQWGAFYGTELDLQLRRRGVRTIVIGGIATNFGVESTARDAWERGYALVFVEDGMTSIDAEAHACSVKMVFPRIGRVRSTEQVLAALAPHPELEEDDALGLA